MTRIGIAIDLGTSGFRGQALDLDRTGRVLSTAVTARHPLPGANVMDHLHCALELGVEWAQQVIVFSVNRIVAALGIDPQHVVRLAVCGNPIQLSIFQGIEIRDLAYAGKRKLEALGVVPPDRDARKIKAREIPGLALPGEAEVLIPPAVRHEIGADALAMMIRTGMLEKDEIAIATDYGTNAEMALVVNGTVYTGSTAAGPALEGQQIEDGLLALPGAICEASYLRGNAAPGTQDDCGRFGVRVLDEEMTARTGSTVDPCSGETLERGDVSAVGITGTGVVALISEGIKSGLIQPPKIKTPDAAIHLADGVKFSEKDLLEAGKAIGSVRAGHFTLCQEAGINLEDVEAAYMSGASGTYVNALKAQHLGMIPPAVKKIYQVGNTSLAMARELVLDADALWKMKEVADALRQHHCMFAVSKTFEKVYVLELSVWSDGLTIEQYRMFLKKYKLPTLPEISGSAEVVKTEEKDIAEVGELGLTILTDAGMKRTLVFSGCAGDSLCVAECPENALRIHEAGEEFAVTIDLALCNGMACRRCETICNERAFDWVRLITIGTGSA